jgi:probable rRNA maturation factor
VRRALEPTLTVRRRVRAGALPATRTLRAWVQAALGRRRRGEIGLLLVGPAGSRALNRRYRHRDRPTNVLSFPAGAAARRAGLLGDLVICPALLRAEARAQGKRLAAHWAHLVVHGVLHLMGFDHVKPQDARRMEQREIRILRRLGFADPYRAR